MAAITVKRSIQIKQMFMLKMIKKLTPLLGCIAVCSMTSWNLRGQLSYLTGNFFHIGSPFDNVKQTPE